MKTFLTAGAILALTATHAVAAGKLHPVDEPRVVPPASHAPAPVFSWHGAYGGIFLGYGLGSSKHCEGPNCALGGPSFPKPGSNGLLGGVTLGYNIQSGNWVYGAEIDHTIARMHGATNSTASFDCGSASGCRTDITGMSTLRARLGYAHGRTLFYGTAGVSRVAGTGGVDGAAPQGKFWTLAPVAGLGVEHAITDRMSLKAEVLHTKPCGPHLVQPAACAGPGCGIDKISVTVARVGINIRF